MNTWMGNNICQLFVASTEMVPEILEIGRGMVQLIVNLTMIIDAPSTERNSCWSSHEQLLVKQTLENNQKK